MSEVSDKLREAAKIFRHLSNVESDPDCKRKSKLAADEIEAICAEVEAHTSSKVRPDAPAIRFLDH